jgi:hypothetical protein
VPVFFVTVQRFFAGDKTAVKATTVAETYGPPVPSKP